MEKRMYEGRAPSNQGSLLTARARGVGGGPHTKGSEGTFRANRITERGVCA